VRGRSVASDRASSPPWPIGSLLLMSSAVFVSVTTELLPTGLLPAMSRDLRVSEGRLGLLVTSYAFMVALLAAPIAMATARIGRRQLLTTALLGYVVCNAITAVSSAYPLTVTGRLVGGVSHGLFWGMLAGYAGRLVSPDRVGRAVTITLAGGTTSLLCGVPLGTALGVAFGWRWVFGIFAVIPAGLALLAARRLPALPALPDGERVPFRDVIRMPRLVMVITSTAVIMLGHFAFITYAAPFLIASGIDEHHVAPALVGYGAAGAIGLALAGVFVDRRLRAALLASTALLAATFGTLAVAGLSAALAVGGIAATGLALGMLPAFLQAATLHAAPGAADQASAFNASAFNIGIGGGALLGGLTLDQLGAASLPLVAAGLSGLGLVVVVAGRRVGVPHSPTLAV
jgi:MFS transporter, DHA1 family, inner membrane transport protein